MGAGRSGKLIEDSKRVEKRKKRSGTLKKLEELTGSGKLKWREGFFPFLTTIPTLLLVLCVLSGNVMRARTFWSFSLFHCYMLTYREGSRSGPMLFDYTNFKEHLLIGWRLRFALFPIEIILIDNRHPSPIGLFIKVKNLHKKDYLLG